MSITYCYRIQPAAGQSKSSIKKPSKNLFYKNTRSRYDPTSRPLVIPPSPSRHPRPKLFPDHLDGPPHNPSKVSYTSKGSNRLVHAENVENPLFDERGAFSKRLNDDDGTRKPSGKTVSGSFVRTRRRPRETDGNFGTRHLLRARNSFGRINNYRDRAEEGEGASVRLTATTVCYARIIIHLRRRTSQLVGKFKLKRSNSLRRVLT